MRCPNCGVDMVAGAAFCSSCGKPAEPLVIGNQNPPAGSASFGGNVQSNMAGLLCYLVGFISGIFFLAVDPYKRDPFVRFHAFQAIFLSVAWFAAYFVIGILTAMLPYMFWRVTWMLHSLLGLGFSLLWLFLMYQAYNHKLFKLPVIGELAAKQV